MKFLQVETRLVGTAKQKRVFVQIECACGCGESFWKPRYELLSQGGLGFKHGHNPSWNLGKKINAPFKNGGFYFSTGSNRWMVRCRDKGQDPWARIVARNVLGRELKTNEVVHHLNGDSKCDRPSNLLICTKGYHSWLHSTKRILI